MQKWTTTLKDADGKEHHYEVSAFGAEEGFNLAMEIGELGAEAAGKAIEAAVLGVLDKIRGGMGNIDVAMAGKAISEACSKVLGKGGVGFVRKLIGSNVMRDGHVFNKPGEANQSKLSFNGVFAANYGEMRELVMFVMEKNFASFFGFSASESISTETFAEKMLGLPKSSLTDSDDSNSPLNGQD